MKFVKVKETDDNNFFILIEFKINFSIFCKIFFKRSKKELFSHV